VSTATLTRELRDALRDAIDHEIGDPGDFQLAVRAGKRDEAHEYVRKFRACLGVLDQIGYAERGRADAYRLTVDAEVAWLLRRCEQAATWALAEESEWIAAPQGVADHVVDEWRRFADLDLDTQAACRLALAAFEER
jgi:hypothetical protein